jgi:uncharacterized protein
MKTIIWFMVALCAFAGSLHAQTAPERRVIEVSGSAERWITPDLFTFKITLVTIEQQESQLRKELTAIGVDVVKDLSICDITSSYVRRKKLKDVLGYKDYRLKLRDPEKIAELQDQADRLNITRLDLIESEHSEITRLRRETKMDAIKAAKDKAEYMLGAIGQHAGKAVYIKEEPDETPRNEYTANISSNSISNISRESASYADDNALSFSQIRLRYVVVAKFEIE